MHLKIASVMAYTGSLASFGDPLEGAIELAVKDINAALKKDGLDDSIELAGTQDGQSENSAAVEAATKLVTVNQPQVIIGTLGSTSTIAVAQSVTIPNGVMLVSPVASSPAIVTLDDSNLVFQMYPNDNFQASELVQVIKDDLGTDVTLNVGYRNDDYGNGISKIFADEWKKVGGTIGTSVSWTPTATNFSDAAQKMVSGSPDAWVIFDFPDTFQKVAPSLVQTGQWDPKKTFVSSEFRAPDALAKIGAQATTGLRGVAPASGATQLQTAFAAHYKAENPDKSATGYEGFAYDAVLSSFFAAMIAGSSDPSAIGAEMEKATNGTDRFDYRKLADAFKAIADGSPAAYEGVSGPLKLDDHGAPTATRYDVWQYTDGKIATIKASQPIG